MTRSLLSLLFAAFATAQPPELPRLGRLGPLPADLPALDLDAGGVLHVGDRDLELAGLATGVGRSRAVVLRIDRHAPMAVVQRLLDTLHELRVTTVHFAAALPGNGRHGALRYALPPAADAHSQLRLRLTFARPGVPVDSVEPPLRTMARGLAGCGETLQLDVVAAGDCAFEPTLQALAAVVRAGVKRVALHSDDTTAQAATRRERPGDLGALARATAARTRAPAMDLGPVPAMQVPARALPHPHPQVGEQAFGVLHAAEIEPPAPAAGGAGGRYAGRAGGRAAAPAVAGLPGPAAAIEQGASWYATHQAAAGYWPDDEGTADLEATALLALCMLGDGATLRSGPYGGMLARGIGWLMGAQRHDGSIAGIGPDSVRRHAWATYALAEAYGLSEALALRGHLDAALRWLAVQQRTDGGFADGSAGAPSDTVTTALAIVTAISAKSFRVEPALDLDRAVGWLDRVSEPSGRHRLHVTAQPGDEAQVVTATAAALLARLFAGPNPGDEPRLAAAADVVLTTADAADPLGACWTTYALYQMGGRHWDTWSRQLTAVVDQQDTSAEGKGSWAPAGGRSRAATSALRLLTLEAYYRYTRLVR